MKNEMTTEANPNYRPELLSPAPIVTDAKKFASLFDDPAFYAVWKKQQEKRAMRMHRAYNRRNGIDRS